MKNVRKIIGLALCCGAVMFAVSCAGKDSGVKKIGFIQLIDNSTFKEMRDGFYARMAALGYGPDKAEIVYKEAQGDVGTLNSIAQEFENGPYDVVVTLATPATQAFVNLQSSKPDVFIAVSDPVAVGVVSDMKKPDKNATGTSNYIPMDANFELADKLTPGIKRYGFIYSLGEPNAVSTINKAKTYLDSRNLRWEEVTVSNSSEVQQAAEALVPKVDAIFIPNDSLVVSAMAQIAEIATAAKVPVYGTALVHVQRGALATVGIDDKLIGERSAEIVVEILKGKTPAEIPVVTFDTLYTVINKKTAERLGISADGIQNATFVD